MNRILTMALALTLGGCGMPSLLITPVANTSKLEEIEVDSGTSFASSKVAVIEVEGLLINARSGGFLGPEENKLSLFQQQMERAAKDSSVRAVVLRINSPGGTVACSDTMYEIVRRFRAKTRKPVIASTQEVAASGGFYIACASDQIVAHPSSVVGSIGVIFESFEFVGTMDKLGITSVTIKSGPMKDMASPFRKMDPKAEAVIQGMIDEDYVRFVEVVTAKTRITDPDRLKTITDGRVFSGQQAKELGLVDQLGMLDDAIELARTTSGSPGAKVVMYKRPYGYSGSIYASAATPAPQASVLKLELPEYAMPLPSGFYYLWRP
ncbi:MAG: signal peptide peptidase SppA [Tepidisphaeraceae bacterium]